MVSQILINWKSDNRFKGFKVEKKFPELDDQLSFIPWTEYELLYHFPSPWGQFSSSCNNDWHWKKMCSKRRTGRRGRLSRSRSNRKDYWKSFQLNSIISLNLWYNYNFLFSFSLYHFSGFNFSTFQMQLINFDYYFFVVISVYFIWIYFGSLLHFNRKFTINLNGNCIHCRWILMATYFYSNI